MFSHYFILPSKTSVGSILISYIYLYHLVNQHHQTELFNPSHVYCPNVVHFHRQIYYLIACVCVYVCVHTGSGSHLSRRMNTICVAIWVRPVPRYAHFVAIVHHSLSVNIVYSPSPTLFGFYQHNSDTDTLKLCMIWTLPYCVDAVYAVSVGFYKGAKSCGNNICERTQWRLMGSRDQLNTARPYFRVCMYGCVCMLCKRSKALCTWVNAVLIKNGGLPRSDADGCFWREVAENWCWLSPNEIHLIIFILLMQIVWDYLNGK